MERVEQGKDICDIFEQIVDKDDEFLNNKTKIYCDYVLSFNKDDYRIEPYIYEKCEDYVKKYHKNNEIEMDEKFINSYLKKLSKEGKEICKEVDLIFINNDELIKEKTLAYCNFICKKMDVHQNLYERCNNYREKVINFSKYESVFKTLKNDLDMRNLRISLKK